MATFRFHFQIITSSGQFQTSTIREFDNPEAALKEIWFLYPEAIDIQIIKHYQNHA